MKKADDSIKMLLQKESESKFADFKGISQQARDIRYSAYVFALDPLGNTVLITGERGVGKEVIARLIHENSVYVRNKKKFVCINCAELPIETCESILFGHEKGSFADAKTRHEGVFKQAQDGTLFLDEIGILPKHIQGKLLRAIQSREIRAMGATETEHINCRMIFATNQNLVELCKNDIFKGDLFDRFDVCPIHISPLRERREDIGVLIKHVFEKNIRKFNLLPDITLDPHTLSFLLNYDYPGNVREMENMFTRASVFASAERWQIMRIDSKSPATEHTLPVEESIEAKIQRKKQEIRTRVEEIFELHQQLHEGKNSADKPPLFDLPELKEWFKALALDRQNHNKSAAARILRLPRHQYDAV
ncbi:MAG: sigma 54-interacting transcriptional regulator [Bacteroidota bacterium]